MTTHDMRRLEQLVDSVGPGARVRIPSGMMSRLMRLSSTTYDHLVRWRVDLFRTIEGDAIEDDTPLRLAVVQNRIDLVQGLLTHAGANPNDTIAGVDSCPLTSALENGNSELACLLVRHGATFDHPLVVRRMREWDGIDVPIIAGAAAPFVFSPAMTAAREESHRCWVQRQMRERLAVLVLVSRRRRPRLFIPAELWDLIAETYTN